MKLPTDKWSTIASRSSLGMAIAAQQAPIGSMAHALYEQNQLARMLEASLSHLTPIQFGFGGYVRKSYPTYGPLMLRLTSLKPDDHINKSAQHALLPKAESKPLENSGPRPMKTYSVYDGEPLSTFESRHRVLGGKNPPKLDGFAPTAILGYSLVEDFVTLVDPNATSREQLEASFSLLNPVGKVKKAKNAMDTIEGMDTAANLVQGGNKVHNASNLTQKEKDQFAEYIKKLDKGTGKGGINYPLSSTNKKHINKHNIESIKQQSKYLSDSQSADKLESSFFNPNWSKDDINKYAEIAYNDLKSQGKTGNLTYEIGGEIIDVFIHPDGQFGSVYGRHKFTVEDIRKMTK